MPVKVDLLGPGMYIFFAFFVLIGIFGIWMMIDTMRAKRRSRKMFHNVPREPLSIYALCGGLYMVLLLLMIVLIAVFNKQNILAMVVLFAAPILVIVELAYLLRVVYPKPAKGEAPSPVIPGSTRDLKRKDSGSEAKLTDDNFLDRPDEKKPAKKAKKDKS